MTWPEPVRRMSSTKWNSDGTLKSASRSAKPRRSSACTAPGDRQVTVAVRAGEVAGFVPAVLQRLGGVVGAIVVAEHHLRAAHGELAFLFRVYVGAGTGIDEPHRAARERQSARARRPVTGRPVHRDHGRRLGDPVAVQERNARRPFERLRQRSWSRRMVPVILAAMRISVAADERVGVAEAVVEELRRRGHDVRAHGALSEVERDDWAWASEAAARDVPDGRAQAVVCCWTGTGASIAANKVPGVRAALCLDAATA